MLEEPHDDLGLIASRRRASARAASTPSRDFRRCRSSIAAVEATGTAPVSPAAQKSHKRACEQSPMLTYASKQP